MRISEGTKTVNKLIDEGWDIDHDATTKDYRPAGSISPMATKKGVQYCRVHFGQTIKKGKYQWTTVMSRKA